MDIDVCTAGATGFRKGPDAEPVDLDCYLPADHFGAHWDRFSGYFRIEGE